MITRHFLLLVVCLACLSCQNKNKNKNQIGEDTQQVTDSISEFASEFAESLVDSNEIEPETISIDSLYNKGDYWNKIPVAYTYHFTGSIDNKYKFDMYLHVDGTTVGGQYSYLSKETDISFEGTLLGDNLRLKETEGHVFNGKFDYNSGQISGTWTSADGKRILPFEMKNPYGVGYSQNTYMVHITKTDRYKLESIQITNKNGEKMEVEVNTELYDFAYGLSVQDYNFDGYLDISLVEFMPAYPPLKYKYMLYVPEYGDYNETEMYDDIYTLVDFIDFRQKTAGLMVEGRHYSQSIYKFQDDTFYKIYTEFYSGEPSDENSELIERYSKIENGTTVEITKKEYENIYGIAD